MKHNRLIIGVLVSALLATIFAFGPYAVAKSILPLPDATNFDLPAPEGETSIEKFENFVGPLSRSLRMVIGAIAIAMIVVSGFIMVIAGSNEETAKTQRKSLTWGILGLLVISIAGPLAEVFDYRQGNFLQDGDSIVERVSLFNDTTRIVITFLKYLLGSLATLMFIRSGAIMITGSSNEENITREKKNLALGAGGLLLVFVSELIVRKIFYDVEYNGSASQTVVSINQNALVTQLVAATNLMISFVGPLLMLFLVVGGVMYVTAGDNTERAETAKKVLINSTIGIAVIYGAFALVSTVITGVF